MNKWKKDNVYYIVNGRTQQKMPHYYQFYEDFVRNEEDLTIKKACQNLKIPHLIVHGTDDQAVLIEEANALKSWNPRAALEIISGANHVFGTFQPYTSNFLPETLLRVAKKPLSFFQEN